MTFKFFEEAAAKRRAEFMAHVSPEVQTLAERLKAEGRRLSHAEYEALRMNSYEQRLLVPLLDDEALCKLADYCINMEGPKARLGEYELSEHYGDAVRRELAPLLVERLRYYVETVSNYQQEAESARARADQACQDLATARAELGGHGKCW